MTNTTLRYLSFSLFFHGLVFGVYLYLTSSSSGFYPAEIYLDVSIVSEKSLTTEASAKEILTDTQSQSDVEAHVNSEMLDSNTSDLGGYEEDISLYLQKYINFYFPNIAHHYQGQATVRIRIKKNGQIIWSSLDSKTNILTIDKAILLTLKKITLLPYVPDRYTQDQEVELLIPLLFK